MQYARPFQHLCSASDVRPFQTPEAATCSVVPYPHKQTSPLPVKLATGQDRPFISSRLSCRGTMDHHWSELCRVTPPQVTSGHFCLSPPDSPRPPSSLQMNQGHLRHPGHSRQTTVPTLSRQVTSVIADRGPHINQFLTPQLYLRTFCPP